MRTPRTRSILLRFDMSNPREASFVAAYDQIQKADTSRRFKASIIRESFGVSLLEMVRRAEAGIAEPLPVAPVLKPVAPIDPPVPQPEPVTPVATPVTKPQGGVPVDPPVTKPASAAPVATPVAKVAEPRPPVILDDDEKLMLHAIRVLDRRTRTGNIGERGAARSDKETALKNLAARIARRVNPLAKGASIDEAKLIARLDAMAREEPVTPAATPSKTAESDNFLFPIAADFDEDTPEERHLPGRKVKLLMW